MGCVSTATSKVYNIAIERRSAEGKLDRLESIVRELVAIPVDVVVAAGHAATVAAAK